MIIRLLPDQISKFWNALKFGALAVNHIGSEARTAEYCRNLMKNLMAEKYQAWIGADRETRAINDVAITSIRKDIGDIPYVLIEAVYGFSASPLADHDDFVRQMISFARNSGCDSVIAHTANERLMREMERLGMAKVATIYRASVPKEGNDGR